LGVLMLVGCAGVAPVRIDSTIRYQGSVEGMRGVVVRDARTEGWGARVGEVHSSVSGPMVVDDQRADVVTATVGAATADALGSAGVGIGPGGRRLEASVRRYWVTGTSGYFAGGPTNVNYSATIEVDYRVVDEGGRSLWDARVAVHPRDDALYKGPRTMTEDIAARALKLLASRARELFATPAFHQALRQ
jgi:hypothetical protein